MGVVKNVPALPRPQSFRRNAQRDVRDVPRIALNACHKKFSRSRRRRGRQHSPAISGAVSRQQKKVIASRSVVLRWPLSWSKTLCGVLPSRYIRMYRRNPAGGSTGIESV